MAKLYFRYGAMGSSKTANALMARFNYEERGQKTLLCKPQLDTRDGDHMVHSRIGLEYPCVYFHEMRQMDEEELKKNACIIVGLTARTLTPVGAAKHIFSHREWHMKGYLIRVDELAPKREGPDSADWIYIEPSETREKYPIPSAFAIYAKGLNMKLGARENDPGQ